jgi:thiol-disulfide isomerase/thioredoxin
VRRFLRWLAALAVCALSLTAVAVDPGSWGGGATPPLELEDMHGRVHRLADYRGKVVLVNFWATWCEPCRDEMPSIERLRSALADQPFAVLAVNLAEPRSRIEKFLQHLPSGFAVLLDRDTQAAKDWDARVLPATYLVDPTGRVRHRHFGAQDWSAAPARAMVRELLEGR